MEGEKGPALSRPRGAPGVIIGNVLAPHLNACMRAAGSLPVGAAGLVCEEYFPVFCFSAGNGGWGAVRELEGSPCGAVGSSPSVLARSHT